MARVCFNKATVLPTAWGLDHLIFDGRGGGVWEIWSVQELFSLTDKQDRYLVG